MKIGMSEKEELVSDGCFKKAEMHELNQELYVESAELPSMLPFPTAQAMEQAQQG